MRKSDAISNTSPSQESVLLVRPFTDFRQLLRLWLTFRSGSTPLLGHKSFAVACPLTLVGTAFFPVLVHRPAASIHAFSPQSVALMQLRFISLTVTSL
jgi:hypothetical protein